MRDRITIQNVTRSKSDTGFAQESWADSAIVWANAESKLLPSNETVIDGKNTAKNISDFTIRYTTGIHEESRIIWNDKLYQVRNIKVSHDRRFISFQGEFYDSYILTGVSVAAILLANANVSSNIKVIHNVLAAMNAIATTNAELTVNQQGQVLVAASLSAFGNLSANATKVITINSNVTANGTLVAALTKVININSTLNANATLVSDVLVSKTLSSTLNANATTSAAVDVVTQGSVSVDAAVNALGTVAAEIKRTVTMQSSPTTSASTALNATLTKVIEASVSATANTQSTAQLSIPVNAAANATANTSANATLSYTVNAELNATAQTTVDANITRIISAQMNATAQTSLEAGVGVTFVASAMASASLTNATVQRTSILTASVTGAANVTNATLTNTSSVDADAQAFFNRVTAAGGTLTSTEQTAVNTLVLALKADSIWDKMKAIYPMVGASAGACAQNLKSSSFTGTFSSGWTFASTGVKPNGTSAFMQTNCFANNFTENSQHLSNYSRQLTNTGNTELGFISYDATRFNYVMFQHSTANIFAAVQSTDVIMDGLNDSGSGLIISNRRNSTNIQRYRNNVKTEQVVSGNGVGTLQIFMSALNGTSFFSVAEIAFGSLGDGLTDTEASNFYIDVQAFQTTLNRQINP